MLEKLLLAVIITFCLNLFLGVRLPNATTTASSSQLAETPIQSVKLLLKQGFDTAIKRHQSNRTAFRL